MLSDGEWHDESEIVQVCGPKVDPAQAARRARAHGTHEEVPDREAVLVGTRLMIRHVLRGGKTRGKFLSHSKQWKANPNFVKKSTLGHKKLTVEIVREARALSAEGITLRELCEKYGVSSSTMSLAINGKTWKDA